MKKAILMVLLAGIALPVRAQLFSPESWGGAFWGGLIGGIVGSDCRQGFSGEGAAIGAGVGFLAGAIAGEANRRNYYYSAEPFCPYYSYPAYDYAGPAYFSAPVISIQPGAERAWPTPVRTSQPISRKTHRNPASPALSAHQIPDAPRVPNAPTF